MSEADKQATSILLPTSTVAVYSKDQKTLETARNLIDDWRFARVNMQVEEGDIFTAIGAYKDMVSPDLIIVQTETIEDSLPARLEELASHCSEGTAAIVIGPVNDVYLYRRLIEMGISDYLVKPIEVSVMADVIAKTLIDKKGVTGSRLIAFIGGKGGVGVSALAQAAACGVADMLGQKVLILDTSGGWSTLGVGLGFEPTTTLSEAARAAANDDEDSLNRMLFRAGDKLAVLASGGDVMLEAPVAPEQLERLIDMLMIKYPVIIADLSQAAPDLQKTVVARANQIIVVATPTLSALRLSRTLIHEIKDLRGGEAHGIEMVINMQGVSPAYEVAKRDIEKALELKVSTIIPYAAKVFLTAENQSRKLTEDKDGEQIVRTYLLPLIQKIVSAQTEESDTAAKSKGADGFLGGLMGKLKVK
jgi:pilus assembly protein CpaE